MALALTCAACASPLPPLPAPRPLGGALETSASGASGSTTEFQQPVGELTLPAALAAALQASPKLEAYNWQIRADEARVLQAGLLPNPEVALEAENFAGSSSFGGYNSAETTLFLGQLIELGGKREGRQRVALLDRELSGWDYEAARLDVLTDTTQRYVLALAARERLTLTEETLRWSRGLLSATRRGDRAGAESAVEEARASVVVARMEVEQSQRSVALQAAEDALASSWAGTPQFTSLDGRLDEILELPPLERLSAAIAENPDLARWATEVSRRAAQRELARAEATPDVVAGVGVRQFSESGDTALVLGVEVPLPLFDRGQGTHDAALAETMRARALSRDAQLALSRSLISSYSAAQSAYAYARAIEKRVFPQAKAALEGAQEAYRKELVHVVDVLDAQRALFEARTEHLDALERYHIARAELERLVGSPLTALGTAGASPPGP